MLQNYIKTAWRNIKRSKAHSFINVTGLAAGMAVALLIGLWIYDEVSFDRNFPNYKRIGQVIQNVTNNGEVQTWTSVPYPLAEELRKKYGSDFKRIVMSTGTYPSVLAHDEKRLYKTGGYFEKGALEMFSIPMVQGDWHALEDPSSIVISASTARAYFGDENPMNKVLKIDQQPGLKITGVFKDFPTNSSFAGVDYMVNWEHFANLPDGIKTMEDPWRPNAFNLYIEMNANADFKTASLRIRDAKLRNVNAQLAKKKPALFIQPMREWHLYSEFSNGVNVGGRITYVWMFGIIGLFVLLLACINFMNLSTARSEKRAREVGIRKAIGSLRKQLIIQFFVESILVVLFALVFSLILVQLCLPIFNEVADKKMSILWTNPIFWTLVVAFALLTGLIAGSYPALYLSSFQPVRVLKGVYKAGKAASLPRKVLLVIQFTVSVTLIIGTFVVYQQIQYAKNRPMGYNQNGLVSLPINNEIHKHFAAINQELLNSKTILLLAESGAPPTATYSSTSGISWPGKDPNLSIDFPNVPVSYDYGKTIGWEIKEGRDFSREHLTDSSACILNESAIRFMGLKDPVGQQIKWWNNSLIIIGVVKDLVMQSPYSQVRPTVFYLSNEPGNVMIAKLNPERVAKESIAKIETLYKQNDPTLPFTYEFVDESYAKKFGNEERVGKLAGFFAILAIGISCLGLFGLASFMAEQRTKEIGLRKVLGASVYNVWQLLSKDFVFLVLISFLISAPLTYWLMHNWLQNFDYRATISWWIFVIAGMGSLFITICVVSFQSIKAALANPIKSLRTE